MARPGSGMSGGGPAKAPVNLAEEASNDDQPASGAQVAAVSAAARLLANVAGRAGRIVNLTGRSRRCR